MTDMSIFDFLVTYVFPLLILGLCIVATIDCVSDEHYRSGKKAAYLVAIWLLPLIGVFIYYHFSLRRQKAQLGQKLNQIKERNQSE